MKYELFLVIGIAGSLCGFFIAMRRKNRGIIDNDLKQIASSALYPGSFIFILFSNEKFIINLIEIALLNFIAYPVIWGVFQGVISGNKQNRFLRERGVNR